MSDYLGGDPNDQVRRYGEPDKKEWIIPDQDGEAIEALEAHIERFLGPSEFVIHETVSSLVHVDVHIIYPTEERNYYTLITTGMSDLPMAAPESAPDFKHLELMLCLPPDWPMPEDLEIGLTGEHYWPIHALRYLARFPHEYKTWLWWGHTIPNGDPPQPLGGNTRTTGFIVLAPTLPPDEFQGLEIRPDKTIYFLTIVPVHTEEMAYKIQNGAEALEEKLLAAGVSELIDPGRPSVV